MKELNFDMDGTIANLYGVDNWLDKLINEDTSPYEDARPLVNCNVLARKLNSLKRNGWTINIISWTSKSGSDDYHARIAEAKLSWLDKHLHSVRWDNINIVAYGSAKSQYGAGILFDDEAKNLDEWKGQPIDATNMMEFLSMLK